jgi:hypothetical protein
MDPGLRHGLVVQNLESEPVVMKLSGRVGAPLMLMPFVIHELRKNKGKQTHRTQTQTYTFAQNNSEKKTHAQTQRGKETIYIV